MQPRHHPLHRLERWILSMVRVLAGLPWWGKSRMSEVYLVLAYKNWRKDNVQIQRRGERKEEKEEEKAILIPKQIPEE